jgi:hypothetical protein
VLLKSGPEKMSFITINAFALKYCKLDDEI